MKVFVLYACGQTDVSGEMCDPGEVAGVYSTLELAEEAKSKLPDGYFLKRNDFDIEKYEVDSDPRY